MVGIFLAAGGGKKDDLGYLGTPQTPPGGYRPLDPR